jgi:zinc transporter ZupT
MNDARARRIAVRALSAGAGIVGGVLGYDIGDRISGALLGVVMAANAAVIGSLLVGTLAERLLGAERKTPGNDESGGR